MIEKDLSVFVMLNVIQHPSYLIELYLFFSLVN